MTKTITLTNLQVLLAVKAIEEIKLDSKKSFARRRFLRDIKYFVTDLEAERKELLQKYVEKKGDELKKNGNEYIFTAQNRKKYNREFDKLNYIEVIIDVSEANQADILTVSEVLFEEAKKIEDKGKDGLDSSSFEYVEYLKEISKILKNE